MHGPSPGVRTPVSGHRPLASSPAAGAIRASEPPATRRSWPSQTFSFVDLRHRSASLSAAGKDSKRLREAPTPQSAAATRPNLPGSDPLRVGDAGRSAVHPTQPNPAASPHLGERRGGPEPSGLSSEDAEGLGRGRQRGSDAACGALPAPTPLAPPAGPDAGGPAPPPKVQPRPGH